MRVAGIVVCVVLLSGVSGCAVGSERPGLSDRPEVEPLPILWEQAGLYCNVKVPVRLVARDRAGLAQLPIADVPVDFDKQMVLIAAMGLVPTDRYGIRISQVWRQGQRIYAQVRRVARAQGGQAGELKLCSPYHIVVVPRSDLNVEGFSTRLPADPRGYNPYR